MTKTKTTINIDSDILKMLKLKAIDKEITLTELMETYFKFGIVNDVKLKKGYNNKQFERIKRKYIK